MSEGVIPRWEELPDILEVAEVAQYLRISIDQVYREIREGRLAVLKFGRRRLVPKAALEKALTPAIE